MGLPPLLVCNTEEEYKVYYEQTYCHSRIVTFDNIRVYFRKERFQHAFYESSKRDGVKDRFSHERACRMNWIAATLCCPDATLYMGWDKAKGRYDAACRVCVVYEDFVVIIRLRLMKSEELKGDFVTCYQADNSIGKIKTSPKWTRESCIKILAKKKAAD